jgi:hypothetical protein
MKLMNEIEFRDFYLSYLDYLEEKMKMGRVIFEVKNYNNPKDNNPGIRNNRELIQIKKDIIYVQEIGSKSGRETYSQAGLKEIFAFYKYFEGDLTKMKRANYRTDKKVSKIAST